MAVMDVARTVMYAVTGVVFGAAGLLVLIALVVLMCWQCCSVESAEERAAAERRAALVAEYALAQLRAEAPPAPAEVELGYFPFSAEGRNASEKLVCAICLEVFEHGEKCSEVPACLHLFHLDCIVVWIKTSTTCPLCRRHIVAGSEQLSAADDMV